MILKKDQYQFDVWDDVYIIAASRDYIITNYGYKGIYVFNKHLKLISKILLMEDLIIDKIFTKFNTNTIALYCSKEKLIWILDLEKNKKNKIDISSLIDADISFFLLIIGMIRFLYCAITTEEHLI